MAANSERLDAFVGICFTPTDKRRLEDAARAEGLPASLYARRVLLASLNDREQAKKRQPRRLRAL
jgi:hypothetical protein